MAPITIVNHSFEDPPLEVYVAAPEIPGWSLAPEIAAGNAGVYHPGPLSTAPPTDGYNVAYITGTGYIFQVLNATLQPNTVYTLRADFFARIEDTVGWSGSTLQLVAAGGGDLSSVSIPPGPGPDGIDPGGVKTSTVTFTALPDNPYLGYQLAITIVGHANPDVTQLLVDNVRLDASPYVPPVEGPEITSVTQPQAGETDPQNLTITGTNFPDPPTVTILGPDTQPIATTVQSASATQIVVRGIFSAPGSYTVTVNGSDPYVVQALPPIVIKPVITNITQPTASASTQPVTITGTNFPSPPTVTILGPDTQPIANSVSSASSTQIVVSAIFPVAGGYTVTVNDSDPYVVQALPPVSVPTITSVTRPTAAQGSQSVTITGTNFPDPPTVTITGPDTQPIALSVISATATHITVTGIFPLAGTYHVTVSGSAPFPVESAPPVIASVLPLLVSGWQVTQQIITIIGSGFHPNPKVQLFDPDGTSRAIVVTSSSANAILAVVQVGASAPAGTYTLTVDDSPPFALTSVPRPVITAIDPIFHGITDTQDIVIHGTGFAPTQLIQIYDPSHQLMTIRILSVTPTAITVRSVFLQPGLYRFQVGVADQVQQQSIAKPATITYTSPIFDDRSPQYAGGGFTFGGFGFTASQGPAYPPIPVITFTDPNGQPVTFTFSRSEDTWVGIILHPPLPPGEYTISVDGSPPWHQQSIPFAYALVTGVDPAPQAGTLEDQYLTLTGTDFPADVAPSVIVSAPGGQGVTVTVIPPWTSTSVTIRGVFYTPGRWGFRVGQGAMFSIDAIPPVGPVATISAVTRPATGSDNEQFLTIQGTLFNVPPIIHITNPSGHAVDFKLLYGSSTAAVISGIFNAPGTWTIQIDNSPPFTVDALPEPAEITAVERPQAALDTTQTIRIDGNGFTGDPVVTVTGPSGQPIDVSVISSTANAITIELPPDLPEGVYTVSADYSPGWGVLALPIPAPTLTSATAIQSGLTATQIVTLSGTWMRDPVTMTCVGPPPQGNVPVTVISATREQVEVSGVFLYPGQYSFVVTADGRSSLPRAVDALPPAPPSITDVQPRPQAGLTTPQSLTLQTTGFLTGPSVTVTGPDGLNVPVSLVSAPSLPWGPVTVSGVFYAEGDYTVSVDGSASSTITAIPIPRITAVQQPQAGVNTAQTITITGTDFPAGSTVTITDPNGQPVTVTVDSVTPTSISVTGVFWWPGTYTVRAGINPLSALFSVEALTPIPVITSLLPPPQSGIDTQQQVTISGLWFPDPPNVSVIDPDGHPLEVTVISSSPNTVVISGVWETEGRYTVTVANSPPAYLDALAIPPPTIMHVTAFQAGLTDDQDVTISGVWFPDSPEVTVLDPNGEPMPIGVYSSTSTSIDIGGIFTLEGTYTFQVNDSNLFLIDALPPPPPPPPPTILRVSRPQAGLQTAQTVTITGTNFPAGATVTVTGPDGTPIPVTVVSGSTTAIMVSGVFLADGIYTFQVEDSAPFPVQSLAPIPPPPPFISHPIRRLRQFVLPTSPDHRRMFITRLELLMRTGIGLSRGKGSDPQVMMQLSRDGGKTWSAERWRSAGETADYLRRVRWLREGHYRDGVIRFVMSDPVDWQLLSLSGDLTEGSN